jgi:FtsZ-interacting cell division protein ZipA
MWMLMQEAGPPQKRNARKIPIRKLWPRLAVSAKNSRKHQEARKSRARENVGKWMYVHKDASEEPDPAVDRDDEEPLPGAKSEPPEASGQIGDGGYSAESDDVRGQPDGESLSIYDDAGDDAPVVETNEQAKSGIVTSSPKGQAGYVIPRAQTQQAEPKTAHENSVAWRQDTSEEGGEVVDCSSQKQIMSVEGTPATEATLTETTQT